MRMRCITLVQGSERVRRCTNQDGTFPRAVHNFSSIPCFRQLFWQSGSTRTLAPFCYCTWSEGAMIATDHWRARIGNVPVLPRPHLQHSQQDKPQGCPLSTFTMQRIVSTPHWLVTLAQLLTYSYWAFQADQQDVLLILYFITRFNTSILDKLDMACSSLS